MSPRLQPVLSTDRRGETPTPVVAREVRTYILDGVRMDKIGVGAGII